MVELLVRDTTLCYNLSFRMSPAGDLLPHSEIRLTDGPRACQCGGKREASVPTYLRPTDPLS